jgi:hypothetical protein
MVAVEMVQVCSAAAATAAAGMWGQQVDHTWTGERRLAGTAVVGGTGRAFYP